MRGWVFSSPILPVHGDDLVTSKRTPDEVPTLHRTAYILLHLLTATCVVPPVEIGFRTFPNKSLERIGFLFSVRINKKKTDSFVIWFHKYDKTKRFVLHWLKPKFRCFTKKKMLLSSTDFLVQFGNYLRTFEIIVVRALRTGSCTARGPDLGYYLPATSLPVGFSSIALSFFW